MSNQKEKESLIRELISFFNGQAKLGVQVNVCQQTVSKWLNGRSAIPPKKALKIEKLSKSIGKKHITAKKLTPELDWAG